MRRCGCDGCFYNEKPKLIKNWEELFAIPPNDKYKIIENEDGCGGWIFPIEETAETSGDKFFDYHIYLSTHTFYGNSYIYYTRKLQEFGFNVILDNWDKEE